jgi:hypothetical protein
MTNFSVWTALLTVMLLTASTAMTAVAQKTQTVDKGDFKIGFSQPKKSNNAKNQQTIRDTQEVFAGIVKELNATFKLPHDIFISFEECGHANAYYDPNEKQIQMCYELIENFYNIFKEEGKSSEKLDDEVAGAFVFIFFHELGHAVIDAWDLPITGKEEDAVDQLSSVLLIEAIDSGEEMAFNGALSFALQEDEITEDSDFAGQHSFNKQRFFNITCLIYGNNPEKYDPLVSDEILPQARAATCSDEYQKSRKAWFSLLAPYIKNANTETENKSADDLSGLWRGTFAEGRSDLEINIASADKEQVKGEIIIRRAFAGKTQFTAEVAGKTIEDFACKAYLAGSCTVSNLQLSKGKLIGTLIFNNGGDSDITHDFALVKTP